MRTKIIVILAVAVLATVFTYFFHNLYAGSEQVVCTKEAKLCPDGTTVGRSGTDCSFAACRGESFLDCVAKGNPVMESYPRQCRWPNGTGVTEVIEQDLSALEILQSDEPYSCTTDADCVVKNVGNCCGYFPACVNAQFNADPSGVSAACEREGKASVCGFSEITSCSCVNNRCASG